MGDELEDLALQSSVRREEAKMVEYLADGDLLVLPCGNCQGHSPFAFIPFITWMIKKLEKHLPPDHVVSHNARLFKGLTAALNMP